MKTSWAVGLSLVTLGLGFVLGVIFGQVEKQDIISISSNLTFYPPDSAGAYTPARLDDFALDLDKNDRLIWSAIRGGPSHAQPAHIGELPNMMATQFMTRADVGKNKSVFSAFDLEKPTAGNGYSVVVLCCYSTPLILGLGRNITFESRQYWIAAADLPGAASDPLIVPLTKDSLPSLPHEPD